MVSLLAMSLWLGALPAASAGETVKYGSWTENGCTFNGRQRADFSIGFYEGKTYTYDSDCDLLSAAIRYYETGYGYRYIESTGNGVTVGTSAAAYGHYTRHRGLPDGYP